MIFSGGGARETTPAAKPSPNYEGESVSDEEPFDESSAPEEIPENEEQNEEITYSLPSPEEIPEGCIPYEPLYPGTTAEKFAYALINCNFDKAAKYLHPDLRNALGGDVRNNIEDDEIFRTPPIGLASVHIMANIGNTDPETWDMKLSLIQREHAKYGIAIPYSSEDITQYIYNFGKITEERDRFIILSIFENAAGEIIWFDYILTN